MRMLFFFLLIIGTSQALELPDTCKLGKVKFSHKKHIGIAGDCAKCHHLGPPEIWSCKKCHSAPPTKSIPKLKEAYHKKCIDCHKEKKASTLCTICHSWKKEKIILSSFLPEVCIIGTSTNVTFPHNKHMGIANCQKCHHMGEPRKCAECHKNLTLRKPDLKGAFHRRCILCHKETKEHVKETKGPAGCKECHKNN